MVHLKIIFQRFSQFCLILEDHGQYLHLTLWTHHLPLITWQVIWLYHAREFELISNLYKPQVLCLFRGDKPGSNRIKCEKGHRRQIPPLLSWFWLWCQFWLPEDDVTAEQWRGTTDLWRLWCWLTAEGIFELLAFLLHSEYVGLTTLVDSNAWQAWIWQKGN